MMIPTVHLNGTTGEILRDQHITAAEAVQQAIDALCEAGPHSRDFYVQGPDAGLAAQREHESCMKRLKDVRDELRTIAEGIQDQLDVRDAARRSR
jgi:DNA-binding LacI/PurR family transcriptional regulator